MTAAGLQIVYTLDEVDFVQNLVFYIERAYRYINSSFCFNVSHRTPDYGIWERGNKINHGQPELNSSSIGMVVAALQAINGINLFGSRGGPNSVIHVLPDEITRNYTTLHSSLPRESASKEVDSALLSIIGYPAFAVHDVALLNHTREEIEKKLKGKYGCKRFLRDGHQTVLEDTSRLHYDPNELQMFENIESEWPLFFTYFVLDGLFSGNVKMVEEYRNLLKSNCIVQFSSSSTGDALPSLSPQDDDPNSPTGHLSGPSFPEEQLLPSGTPLLPELYIVPRDKVEEEKKQPHSQSRIPNENLPLVWAQSLFILGELLYEGLLSPIEIDPLGRHLIPSYQSAHRSDTVVQVVLIAEDAELQCKLATFGLETQTPDQVAPITISHPSALRDAYGALGANPKLHLSGRPKRPVGTLGTCKVYRVQGRLYVFTPHFMDKEEFYMTMDNDYLVSVFENELRFVRKHWNYPGSSKK